MAQQLRNVGYKDVRILKGGLGGWANAGLPLDTSKLAGVRHAYLRYGPAGEQSITQKRKPDPGG